MGNKEDIILSSDSPEQVVQSNVKLYIQKLENYKSENSIDKSKYMTEWTSTSSPTRINGDSENELTSGGKYVVAVSQTKAGYLPGKEIPFTIAQQSDILPGGTLAVGGEIVTFNTIELLEGVGDASTFRDLSSGTYLSTGLIEVIIPSIDVKFDSIFDDTNESLAGTTVDVYKSSCLDASGNLLSGVTSEFKITYSTAGPRTAIAKLEADQSYIAIQTTTPSGYVVITPNEFYVDANGKVYDKTKTELISDALLIIKNTVVRGHVKLTKLTSDSRKMGNVEFDLYRTFDSLGVIDSDKDIKITEGIVTDSNGQWTSIGSSLLDAQSGKPLSKGLPVGYYYFKEKVSDGSHHINRDLTTYQLGKEIFKVDIDDQYVTDDDLITCTIVNQPLNSCVRLRKVDKNDATKGLIGAEFSIYKDNDGSIGDFVGSFVTKLKGTVIDYVDEDNNSKQYVISADGEGCYFGLPEGNYIIKETKQPTAYILDAYQKSFTMSDNLYTEVNGSYLDLGNVSNQKTNIKVVYKNKSNEVVSDVEYHIINTDTSVPIVNNTSTTLPQEYAQVFEIGKNYTVVTDSVPEQYMVSSNVEFGLGVSGVLIIGGVNITNQTIVIVLDDYVVPSVTPGPSASESPEPSASESPEPSASVVPIPSASVALEPSASAYPVTSPSAEPEVIPSEVPIVTGGEESPSTTSGEIPVASGTIGPKPTSSIPTNIPSDTPVETLRPSSSPIHTKDPHTTYEIVASETPVKPADTTVPPKTTEEEKKHGGKEKTDNRNPQSEEGKTNSGSDGKGNESDAHSKDDNQKNHNQEANENKHHGIVKTGDHNNLFVYLGISILSIFIFIIVTLMRRKERR